MFDPLYNAFGSALAFFYALVPNLGVAIILLTVAVMLVLFPLTAKSARSMLAMQRLQPEMKKLQAKHKGDRQKLNEEMMKLYQEHKVNPLGGCLPLVMQLPVFFALFHVLRSTGSTVPKGSSLYKALAAAEQAHHGLKFLGMDLAKKATDTHGDLMTALPYYLLVGLVVFTGYLQSRQTQRNTPPGANTQMVIIGKVLPIVFGVFSLNFPSGLVLYFFVSNLWRVGQQELIMRKIAPRDHLTSGRAIDGQELDGQELDGQEPPDRASAGHGECGSAGQGSASRAGAGETGAGDAGQAPGGEAESTRGPAGVVPAPAGEGRGRRPESLPGPEAGGGQAAGGTAQRFGP
jgi:YidC/Oxa1 family membrane protein insertase